MAVRCGFLRTSPLEHAKCTCPRLVLFPAVQPSASGHVLIQWVAHPREGKGALAGFEAILLIEGIN